MLRARIERANRLLLLAVLATGACDPCGAYRRPPLPALSAQAHRESIRVGPLERTYSIYSPAEARPGAPLVIALHGSNASGESFRESIGLGLDEWADRAGFIAAYPDGFEQHWDDCRPASTYSARTLHIDDVGFISALIDRVREEHAIDPARVFAIGFSNGGQLAYRLAVELPERIRAVAVVAAELPTADNFDCVPHAQRSSILIMNGDADPDCPPDGGEVFAGPGSHSTVRSSTASARWFVERLGLQGPPITDRLPGQDWWRWVERSQWGAPGDLEVVLDVIHGGGHQIPSPRTAGIRPLGRIDRAFDGLAEVWSFFARQRALPVH